RPGRARATQAAAATDREPACALCLGVCPVRQLPDADQAYAAVIIIFLHEREDREGAEDGCLTVVAYSQDLHPAVDGHHPRHDTSRLSHLGDVAQFPRE